MIEASPAGPPGDLAAATRAALDAGLNVQAVDLARSAAADDACAAEIRYLGALACARMGAIDEAEKWLAHIDREPLRDSPLAVEVWSLAGRIAKERYAATRDRTSAAARDLAHVAIGCYQRAFALSGAAYPAVNAATMTMLAGDAPGAFALARQALATLSAPVDHWQHASAGEAQLLLGELDAARVHYADAYRLAANKFGDVASMRRQLLMIGSRAAHELAEALPAPQVIAFSGHMIDHPARASPRFPAGLERQVAAALREKLASLGPSIGYAQAACGADILFLEAMEDAGWQTQIVLPFARDQFIATSVSFAGGSWTARFERALRRATRVVVATEEAFLGDDVLFEHAANLIQGMAFLRASELSTTPLMLTVHESASSERVGGTAATARNWTRRGGRIQNIDLAALRGESPTARTSDDKAVAVETSEQSAHRRSLKSLLFADISGFSKMPEQYAPDFAEMFLGSCKRILDSLEHGAVHVNTHGDGLFLVFELPSHAATFAVRLQQTLGEIDWPALGLAEGTGARVALHTGPLFRIFDPLTEKFTFYGTHVNRTARLEPIVRPRQIFATEEFAASLVAENQNRFHCDYIGTMQLAKQFGDARLYRLDWTRDD
jgi:class 3 adenylate cyclase/tetratricopeptide (TPR) repeat protein